MDNNTQTEYVYQGRLVVKTGRRAVRTVNKSGGRRSSGSEIEHVLYEIKGADAISDKTEWVKEDDLYIVEPDPDQTITDYNSFIQDNKDE